MKSIPDEEVIEEPIEEEILEQPVTFETRQEPLRTSTELASQGLSVCDYD